MDEHDKRAREVWSRIGRIHIAAMERGDEGRVETKEQTVIAIARALRAAVAAERERKGEDNATIAAHLIYAAEIVENEGESQEWQRYARVFANRLRAEADFHATRSAPAASPAQAEQRVSEEERELGDWRFAAKALLGTEDATIEAFDRELTRIVRENTTLRHRLGAGFLEPIEPPASEWCDGWLLGDPCEVRLGGTRWIAGRVVAVGVDIDGATQRGWVRVHVPTEDMTVPRHTDGRNADCFRRPAPVAALRSEADALEQKP